jgi:oxysterol-binding protein-related protein 3/6/7
LKAKGFIPIQWYGKCEAEKVSTGTYAVAKGRGGMYGLVLDNTFSMAFSKTATFVLLTYPSNAPPHWAHNLQNLQGGLPGASLATMGKNSPKMVAASSDSVDSLHSPLATGNTGATGGSVLGRTDSNGGAVTHHAGVLQKRRRKRGQGYARRFFSLDFASCTLSYYYSRNSSALRGAIPLGLAAISADERGREISIDSGAEIWHLKARNAKDFQEWARALEKASAAARGVKLNDVPAPERPRIGATGLQIPPGREDDHEWEQVEALVSRIAGTRDAVRRLCKDTAPGTKKNSYHGLGVSPGSTPLLEENGDYSIAPAEKKHFWRRKSSAPSTPHLGGRSTSQLTVPSSTSISSTTASSSITPSFRKSRSQEESSMHHHVSSLLTDLDAVLVDFSTLLANGKRRRAPAPNSASRISMDSTSTGEFYDAEAGDTDRSQLLRIDNRSGEETPPSDAEDDFATDASSISSADEDNLAPAIGGAASLFPVKPKSFEPLPLSTSPKRRNVVPVATVLPPSLISFLRKNVGKDLSTISMPVSANEPLSLLQRVAEQLEYAQLLDAAAAQKEPTQRLLHVAAFAVSQFSNTRCRERAIRKPFNPMLGETFELVRTSKEIPGGFRLLVEKVSHRPVVRMACQADSPNWSFSQSPAPTQKFWGKSAELTTEGRIRISLRLPDGTDELYSWNVATMFLRNVVMGEKYVEPVGSVTVTNESTGGKAAIDFKQKGMFGGRSEDVQVECYRPDGSSSGLSLVGTWTTSLNVAEGGKLVGEIWHAGDLVDNAPQRYGLTTFAAGLNEITEIERGKLPVTDSRLRPDQRAAEKGDLDGAEALKTKLEENQRMRRKEVEGRGDVHTPRWFVKVDGGDEGEEMWKLKGGKGGYWDERSRGMFTGVEDILAV